jgi:hypothetical protein
MIQSDNNEIGFARHLLIMISGETVGNQHIAARFLPATQGQLLAGLWPDDK